MGKAAGRGPTWSAEHRGGGAPVPAPDIAPLEGCAVEMLTKGEAPPGGAPPPPNGTRMHARRRAAGAAQRYAPARVAATLAAAAAIIFGFVGGGIAPPHVAAAAQFGAAPTIPSGPNRQTTCVIANIGVGPDPQGAAAAATDVNINNCFTFPVFAGVNLKALGFPSTPTLNNYAELKAVLAGWTLARDGYPAVWQWVNLSPAVAQGMRAAGLHPTAFLQWVGLSLSPGDTWPPFVPKTALGITAVAREMVGEPVSVAAIVPAKVVPAKVASPTPAQKPVAPVVAPRAAPPSGTQPTTAAGGTASKGTAASGTTKRTASPETISQVHAARREAKPTLVPPPTSAKLDGVAVPCSVAPACTTSVVSHRLGVARESRWRMAAAAVWGAFGRDIEIAGAGVLGLVLLWGVITHLRRRVRV